MATERKARPENVAPAHPPRPRDAPEPTRRAAERAAPFLAWLRMPRPQAKPGIWRYGHEAKRVVEAEATPGRQLISGALITALAGWLLWSLLWNGYLGEFWMWPLEATTPDSWRESGGPKMAYVTATYVYYAIVLSALLIACARIGHFGEVWRRYGAPRWRSRPQALAAASARSPRSPREDPADWPQLRAAGAGEAAERLAAESRAGRLGDIDAARIGAAWERTRKGPGGAARFTETVLEKGAAAWLHPSRQHDLPGRTARHDLLCRQVRLGAAVDAAPNPHPYRGAGLALDPSVLGTSLVAIGPPGSGKTSRLVTPVTEALCLQALARQAAVIAVGASSSPCAPDEDFDVVVRLGRPDSVYDLDLYGGTSDPDEAAALLAEALVGEQAGDGRRAGTALAQLLGPFRAVHERFPSVPELRELLDGEPRAFEALRRELSAPDREPLLRELDARERQAGRSGDPSALLADRVALLDRPAFAPFFDTKGESRQFSLRALEHPLRVRIDLPELRHGEASRVLARLVLAQFTECALARTDRSLFACLVLDEATHTITPTALRGLQRLRAANAGAVLTLSTLDDVPETLRGALLGALGCRMAFTGVTVGDGTGFAEAWGKEWVETQDITDRQIVTDEPFTKFVHFIRRMVTGKEATFKAVTVRTVERERWSASDLANALPPGHAVLSLTTVRGERTPPVLVDLHH